MILFCRPNASLNWRNEGGNFHYERDGYTVNNDTRASAVKKDVEDSLRRMGTDYLDSVIVHYACGSFPVEETVGALENLVREGKDPHLWTSLTVSRQICLCISGSRRKRIR